MSEKKRYILETNDECQMITLTGVCDGHALIKYTTVDKLQDADNELDEAYQRGLDDAWATVKRLIDLWYKDEFDIFGDSSLVNFIGEFTASEAIAKLKAYEEQKKANDEIKVGDEIINNFTKTKGILLEPETENLLATVIVPNNRWNTFNISYAHLTKTGRHFDVESIMKEMKK